MATIKIARVTAGNFTQTDTVPDGKPGQEAAYFDGTMWRWCVCVSNGHWVNRHAGAIAHGSAMIFSLILFNLLTPHNYRYKMAVQSNNGRGKRNENNLC